MSKARNLAPLALGFLLVLIGALFLAINVLDFRLLRFDGLRYILPVLFLLWGASKLIRHFSWNADQLARQPRRSSLLSGLFWTGVGSVWLLALTGAFEFLAFFGLYWPMLLVLFGIGKIVDYYRFQGRIRLRAGELIGVFLIVFIGITAGRVAQANWPGLDFDFPSIVLDDHNILIRGPWGETHRWTDEAQQSAEGIALLQVNNDYGDIRVEAGSREEIEIRLTKEVVADDQEQASQVADRIQISQRREGDLLEVTTNRESGRAGQQRLSTDLFLRVPARLAAVLKSRHGDIRVSGLENTLSVENASGDVDIDAQQGALTVVNEYGHIQVRRSRGEMKLENRRGRILLDDGVGNATVSNLYDLATVRRLEGDVTIKNRFGSVRVSDVSGSVTIDAPGSSVSVKGTRQAVHVQNSQKTVSISESQGPVELETSYSRVELKGIYGIVDLRATHSEITARNMKSKFSCKAIGSRLSLSALEDGFDVVTTLRPITVRGFSGSGVAQNEFDDITISTDQSLSGELSVINKSGNIELRLPSDAGFVLSAQAPSGRIRSEFESRKAEEQAEAEGSPLLETSIGDGGPRVRLQTTQGQIRIRKGGRSRP